jgi:hypothetical protein
MKPSRPEIVVHSDAEDLMQAILRLKSRRFAVLNGVASPLGIVLALLTAAGARAASDPAGIPNRAPDDAIMATPAQVARMAAWARAAFGDEDPTARPTGLNMRLAMVVADTPRGMPFS